MALPLIVGVLIGASILGASVSAVPRTQGPGGDGSPPFTLWLNLNNSSLTGGVYFYVFSVSLSPWVNVTAQWTQFYVYAPSSWREVPVNVTLLSGSGSSLARFDSSLSSWKSNGINGSFSSSGGWTDGPNAQILPHDSFEVAASVSLVSCVLDVGMATVTVPHASVVATEYF